MFTLQRRGELRAPNGDPDLQHELDKHVPYEYIIHWFQEHEGRNGIENRLLVIQSGLASGKSTTIPAEIFGSLVRHRYVSGGGIICTQPRVLTAIANVKQIVSIPAYAPILKIGETIGWSTQFSKLRPRRIGLLSATIGILTMQLQIFTDAEIIALYRFILIDEAHERSLGADVTFAALKGFLQRNAHLPNCPFVVLMSATIDAAKFARYFLGSSRTIDQLVNNIIMCNAAPSFERKIIWAPQPITNIIKESARIIESILDTAPAPPITWNPDFPIPAGTTAPLEHDDILVFVPGISEISALTTMLREMNQRRLANKQTTVTIVVLNSQTVGENRSDYRQLDIPIRTLVRTLHDERRTIISTSVAETGKTFNTLRYVIDAGYSRENEYNPNIKVAVLLSKPAPISRVAQRWGRVGRKFAGVVYPLYTEEIYKQLRVDQFPEIVSTNVTPFILQIVFEQQKVKFMHFQGHDAPERSTSEEHHAKGAIASKEVPLRGTTASKEAPYFRTEDIDMIDPPHPDNLLDGLERAYVLGFIAHGPTRFTLELPEFLAMTEHVDSSLVGITKLGRVALELTSLLDELESIRMILAGFTWNYRPVDLVAIAAFSKIGARDKESELELGTSKKAKHRREEINLNVAYQLMFAAQDQETEDPAAGCDSMVAWHTALGDTFIDGLIMSAAIDKIFAQTRERGAYAGLIRWCDKLNINFESLLRFIELKDNICSALLTLGFDIYRGASILEATSSETGAKHLAEVIMRYKRCIYDGYKYNRVQWCEDEHCYKTFTGLRIEAGFIEKKFPTKVPPQALIFDEFRGKLNNKTMVYDIVADQVSILDGFIGEDPLFSQ